MSAPKFFGLVPGPRGASRRHLVLSISLVVAGVGLGVYANLSRSGSGAPGATPAARTPGNGLQSDATGMVAAIDPETGALTQPTAAQMQELQGPKTDAAQKAPAVTTYRLADGTVIAHLDESFDHYSVLEIGAAGKLQHVCQQPARDCSLHTRQAGPSAAVAVK